MAQERRRRKKSVKADENNTNTNIDTNIDTTDSDGKKEPGQNVGSEGKREMGVSGIFGMLNAEFDYDSQKWGPVKSSRARDGDGDGDGDDESDDDEDSEDDYDERERGAANTNEATLLRQFDDALQKGFRKEELPLWGYLLASLAFLFAAIAVRPPKNDTSFPLPQRQLQLQFQRRLNPWDQVATDHSVLDSVMSGMHQTGASSDFISQVFAASGGALNQNFDVDTLLRFYHALPKKAFIYAIFVAVIGILLSGGLIAWMRHIARGAQQDQTQTQTQTPIQSDSDNDNDNDNNNDNDSNSDSDSDNDNDNDNDNDIEAYIDSDDDDSTAFEVYEEEPEDAPAAAARNKTTKSKSEFIFEKYSPWINKFLLVWTQFAWGFFTVRGGGNGRYVFGQAGNGYFALCAMFLCAMGNSGLTIDRVRQEAKKADFFVHCLTPTSVIVVIELTLGVPWGEWNNRSHSEIATYALVVSVLTLCYGLVTAVLAWYWNNFRLGATIRLVLTIVFLVLWIVAAAMTTFVGPFRTTGNGYFCVWACVLFTVCSFVTIKREILGAETQQNAAPEPAPEPALELATTQTNTSEIV